MVIPALIFTKLKSVQKIDITSGYKAIPVEHRYGSQSNIQENQKISSQASNANKNSQSQL